MREILRNILPAPIFDQLRHRWLQSSLFRAGGYDRARFLAKSVMAREPARREEWRGLLKFQCHKFEKGMALPEPRNGFGHDDMIDMINQVEAYERQFGPDDMSRMIVTTLREYRTKLKADTEGFEELHAFLDARSDPDVVAGTIKLTPSTLFPISRDDAAGMMLSRRSVRQFAEIPVERSDVEQAVRIAQQSPSVCNRQCGHVFVSTDTDVVRRVLNHQNGNRGFGDRLGGVAVVTADLGVFRSIAERNQPFVDGGIFAMGLLLGLHAVGLGACMLNWSVNPDVDRGLREALGLPDSHVVITLVGFGHVPEQFRVAASPRDPLKEKLHWL